MKQTERTFIAIDLKSFYASVECMDRHLDPMTTHLVVADPERTEQVLRAVLHDKKLSESRIRTVTVEKIGSYELRDMTPDELRRRFVSCFGTEREDEGKQGERT